MKLKSLFFYSFGEFHAERVKERSIMINGLQEQALAKKMSFCSRLMKQENYIKNQFGCLWYIFPINFNYLLLYLKDKFLIIYLSIMKFMYNNLVLILFLVVYSQSIDKVVNYNQESYASLHAFFGPGGVQTPDDCGDKIKHITSVHDPILNKNVFVHTLHRHGSYEDSDRCIKFDRQRVETSVDSRSDKWMQGHNGMQFTYAWKFYSQKDIKLSGDFCHIHQIKLDGSDMGNPCLTVTMRKDHVQLDNQGKILGQCPLSDFVGNWIQFRQKITYGKNGCLTFSATRIRDGKVLINYNGCGVVVDDQGGMIRPKFGFYRSLANKDLLRDQSVRLTDLCVGQADSCHYNEFGQLQDHNLQTE